MRWVRYEAGSGPRYGILDGERIDEVDGDPFTDHRRNGTSHEHGQVRLLIPLEPRTFYAAGLNYAHHAVAAANARGEVPKLPQNADIGYRASNALIAPGEQIVIPKDATERVQYEGELVVVIGQKAKHLTRENALSCVLGYTVGNDVSERSWQGTDATLWRAKNTDTFAPMGPWIETDLDLDAARTIVRVNGDEKISFETNSMIFGVATYLERISRYVTLYPGDMVWMGTEGTAENLKHGDTVEVEITGIGTLSNPVVRES